MGLSNISSQCVKSMVRIPGSGYDHKADPVLLNLSKVSSLAALIQVPQSLPKPFYRLNSSNQISPNNSSKISPSNLFQQKVNNNGVCAGKFMDTSARSLPKTEAIVSIASNKNKRKYPEESKKKDNYSFTFSAVNKIRKNSVITSQTNIQPQKTITINATQIGSATSSSGSSSQILISSSGTLQFGNLVLTNGIQQSQTIPSLLTKLLKERDQLRNENQELNQRLIKFQSIFRNRDSLKYLISRLSQIQ